VIESLADGPLSKQIREVLDMALTALQGRRPSDAHNALGVLLSDAYDRACDAGEMSAFVESVRAHECFNICQHDPYTNRAFTKPRGYAGDAVMLDFVYSGLYPSDTTDYGKAVFRGTTRCPLGLSVLFRRELLAAYINDAIARNPHARILSVASGHCRELDRTMLFDESNHGTFIAFDQDPETAPVVEARFSQTNIRCITASVVSLAKRPADLGQFDLIYAAGLYDYLDDAFAKKLTAALTTMLTPGGTLLLGNFVPNHYGRGYLVGMMDWRLLCRSPEHLEQLVPQPSGGVLRSFVDPHGNVAYVEYKSER
jgi:extracellular factor (EF) 3-hydroxypalmitic acid methyl ester biosynthesis protein